MFVTLFADRRIVSQNKIIQKSGNNKLKQIGKTKIAREITFKFEKILS